ncbi:hypothetical protein [Methanoculleus chikugoensis]|uniref:hypothetical protein n=1 Tax=Methanoculleus chikugoensis TaxID=118126 RepID=UPI001FB246E3|nr:hypothetical protein [Methanoculleus chikugoensis]
MARGARVHPPEEIVMYHYNGTAWEALPTTVKDITGSTVTFTATTPPGSPSSRSAGVERPEEAVTTPPTATTPPATAEPTATETTAAPPAGEPAPEFPLGTVALVGGGDPGARRRRLSGPPLVDQEAEPGALPGLRLTPRSMNRGRLPPHIFVRGFPEVPINRLF